MDDSRFNLAAANEACEKFSHRKVRSLTGAVLFRSNQQVRHYKNCWHGPFYVSAQDLKFSPMAAIAPQFMNYPDSSCV
jgi:ureidoglycolate hydrolase